MISGTEILVQSGQTTNIAIKCRSCHEDQKLTVPTAGLIEVLLPGGARRNIQQIFTNLTAAQRELFLSGICGRCFAEMFPPEED